MSTDTHAVNELSNKSRANTRRRRVAIIGTRGYPSFYGGFETAVRYIAPYLAEHDWDVTVYGRPAWVDNDFGGRDPRIVSRMTLGVEKNALSTLSYGFSATLDCALRGADVALVMNVANGFFLPLLRARGIPTVVNVDGIEWRRAKWGPMAKRTFLKGAQLTAKHASELVVDARAIGDYWREHFEVGSTYIPYGGVPRTELPVPDGLPSRGYALMVARLVPENSVLEFVKAARLLPDDVPVVIVGSGSAGSECSTAVTALAHERPHTYALGHVHDDDHLHALWQHAGAYFHGHTVGGTNPALVQAMALGARIVAADTVFNREVLGGSGRFVTLDAEDIASALSETIRDVRDHGAEAALRARELFSWQGVAAEYARLLDKACRQ